ncbi:Mu transposase C-terminal domain-containing protein [Thalassobius sp. I31.1]|uniref:Mu transposase C-terminal domain-containing protein n=1 Tax=Thalassobius sp. I31.1 TaxID=2109912 RepID=UPI0018E59E35|nr:Mu transposase C-terminal domain-containing protein [Thalassobius sp. I31.1]
MAHRFRFEHDDLVYIDGVAYHLIDNTANSVCFVDADGSANSEICYTHAELQEVMTAERLQHVRRGRSQGKAVVRSIAGERKLSDFSPKAVSKALWRQKWCEALDWRYEAGRLVKTEASIRPFLQEMACEVNSFEEAQQIHGTQAQAGKLLTFRKSPCPKSLMWWHRTYIEAERDPVALVLQSHKSGNWNTKSCPISRTLLLGCIQGFLDLQRPSKKKIVSRTRRAFERENKKRLETGEPELWVPSRSTIYRELERLSPFVVCCAREGVAKAKRKFALFEAGVDVQYPLERVEIDEWKVDLRSLAVNSGIWKNLSKQEQAAFPRTRRWLYVAIDCATRCIVGMRVASEPSHDEAIRVIEMITRDKSDFAKAVGAKFSWDQYGGLECVASDNGASYASDAFEAAVSDVAGWAIRPLAGLPHLRGVIERVFGRFASDLMPLLPGRTFSSSQERGDYDAEASAVLTDDMLTAIFVHYVVDVYHQTEHEGLDGDTPANRWRTLSSRYGVTPPPTPHVRRSAFGERLERTLRGNGVRVAGLYYSCPELRGAFLNAPDRTVAVRVDVMDIGAVSVLIGDTWYVAKSFLNGLDGIRISLNLSRICSVPLTWYFAEKENGNGKRTQRRIQA